MRLLWTVAAIDAFPKAVPRIPAFHSNNNIKMPHATERVLQQMEL
jgi:hypothetical protein